MIINLDFSLIALIVLIVIIAVFGILMRYDVGGIDWVIIGGIMFLIIALGNFMLYQYEYSRNQLSWDNQNQLDKITYRTYIKSNMSEIEKIKIARNICTERFREPNKFTSYPQFDVSHCINELMEN